METVRFAVYIDVEATTLSVQDIKDAIEHGLSRQLGLDKFEAQVYLVPPVEQWQPGYMNTLTAVDQRKVNG
jgi:hypothetical protein